VISVDAKKKELVGQFRNGGREWQPAGQPVQVKSHDFLDRQAGKAIPYGIYDVTADTGWSTSAAITTPPRSRSRRSAAGGNPVARATTRRPAGC
jgi:hypothetical protein